MFSLPSISTIANFICGVDTSIKIVIVIIFVRNDKTLRLIQMKLISIN